MTETPPCPSCATPLTLVWRLVCAAPTSFSLAGAQTKFSATNTPFLVCTCGFEARGRASGDNANDAGVVSGA